jgi:hypothetical protein
LNSPHRRSYGIARCCAAASRTPHYMQMGIR